MPGLAVVVAGPCTPGPAAALDWTLHAQPAGPLPRYDVDDYPLAMRVGVVPRGIASSPSACRDHVDDDDGHLVGCLFAVGDAPRRSTRIGGVGVRVVVGPSALQARAGGQ